MNMQNNDEKFMLAALKLAAKGIGEVEPNPAVGCIIVKDDNIIGQGFHKLFGQNHAEINALEDCRKNNNDPAGATAYVTLEPCCHQGKTPPCTNALIDAGITRVVIAASDPSEYVAGKGIQKLKDAGITTDILDSPAADQAKFLNAWFFKFAKTKKPWVIIKWAQSIDGNLAWADADIEQNWISNEKSRKDAHKLRRSVQAILVGINTVLIDDPLLTARPPRISQPTQPARIVLDPDFKIPLKSQLIKTAHNSRLFVVAKPEAMKKDIAKSRDIMKTGAFTIPMPIKDDSCDINALLRELAKLGIVRLLVEGGAQTIKSFLIQNAADEIRIYIAPKVLASKGTVNITNPLSQLPEGFTLKNISVQNFDGDTCIKGLITDPKNI